ncbi:vacuolar cation/proton exchanger 3 [Quercus suber]|uniref:Vacuolar cation/proton exchanger 3 n=1 Tax=Quercus suber TaxID=58331 RepID=A0AAW0KAL5_QUESU
MASNSLQEPWLLENGNVKTLSKEMRHGRTHHNMSSSSLRKKSDLKLVSKVPITCLRQLLANLQEVILGTKLSVLFPAIPLAIAAEIYGFGRPWVFALSLLGLTPLAERVSFLTEQIAYYTGPTGTSLFCGGIANLRREQKYDRRQADVNSLMLLLALLCHLLPTLFRHSGALPEFTVVPTIQLSRASSIVMLLAYTAYIVFQLWTHRQLFEAQEESEGGAEGEEEVPVIGFWSGFVWLVGMTIVIVVLSEYAMATIEDISLGVALGSATQIAMFVVPLCVVVAWIMGIRMDLDFNTLETTSLALSINRYSLHTSSENIHDGTSHYMKGLVLLLCYIVIAPCFFVSKTPLSKNLGPSKHSQLRTSDDYRRNLKHLTGLYALRGHYSDKYSSIETSTDATDLLVLQF